MKDPLVKGHPVHAMLSDLPLGTTAAGVVFDVLGLKMGALGWRFAARATLSAALVSGSAAALAGLWDYQAVPRDHPARRTGAWHGYLNASALGLLALSVAARWRAPAADGASGERARLHRAAIGLSSAALGVFLTSAWLGGDLVFKLGWRVAPAEHAEQLEQALRERGETALIERAHATVRQYEQEHALVP